MPAIAGQALWQERSESDVREQWVCSGSQVVASAIERIRDRLCNPEVDERVIRIIQVCTVLHLEQISLPIRRSCGTKEDRLERIECRVSGTQRCHIVAA